MASKSKSQCRPTASWPSRSNARLAASQQALSSDSLMADSADELSEREQTPELPASLAESLTKFVVHRRLYSGATEEIADEGEQVESDTIVVGQSQSSPRPQLSSPPEMMLEELQQFQEYAEDGLRRSSRSLSTRRVSYADTQRDLQDAGEDELASSAPRGQLPAVPTAPKYTESKKRAAAPAVSIEEGAGKPRPAKKARKDSVASTKSLIVRLPMPKASSQKTLTSPGPEHVSPIQAPAKKRGRPSKVSLQATSRRKSLKPILPAQVQLTETPALPTPAQDLADEVHLLQGIDPELIALAKRMMHREAIGSKPEAHGKPLVWADTRQALTETLSYFKKPQGGCYSNEGHVYGFLFDGVPHCREYVSADVIIARAGGGMGAEGKVYAQAKDHHISDTQPRSVMNNAANQNPVAIIVGQRNSGMHIAVPYTFCVLGFYKPVAVWTEKSRGTSGRTRQTVKYRFERMTEDGSLPWHAVKGSSGTVGTSIAGPLSKASCIRCHQEHPQIYLISWICLTADCDNFWKLLDGRDAPIDKLLYNPAYIEDRTPWSSERGSWPLRPQLPDTSKTLGANLLYVNSRGMACPKCGRCTQRYRFSGWVCDNPDCCFQPEKPAWSILKPPQLHQPWDIVGDGTPHTRNKHRPDRGVSLRIEHSGGWKISRYTFEGVNGQILHVAPTSRINAMPNGADDMLAELQTASFDDSSSFKLERRRFKGNKGSGKTAELKTPKKTAGKRASVAGGQVPEEPEDVDEDEQDVIEDGDFMGAFSMNYGLPYKFIASGASETFKNAPQAIRASRSMLQWAAKEFLGPAADGHDDFNEELIFTYMQDQKLGYHDDGESGLGPRIGTMTLGGPAEMSIRLKMKYLAGCSKNTNILTPERPLPKIHYGLDREKTGWYQKSYDQRLAAFEELERLKTSDPAKHRERSKELPLEIGMAPFSRKTADDVINLTLRHGDMVFMEGYDIQKFFEHGVEASGFLRYALTCRKILPDHLDPKDRLKYTEEPDTENYVGPIFTD